MLLTIFFATPVAVAQMPVVRILPLGDSITRVNNDVNSLSSDVPGGYRKELANPTILRTAISAGNYSQERSDDLVKWEWWREMKAAAGEEIEFIDTPASNRPAMFYRIGRVPSRLGK